MSESSHYFHTSPGIVIHVRITTPHPSYSNSPKPLLLFLHYWGGSSATWNKLTSPTSDTSLSRIYPTAAVDLRGWGQSRRELRAGESHNNEDGTRDYSISAMTADINSLLEQLRADDLTKSLLSHGLVIVGHSMGAKVALSTLFSLPSTWRDENITKGLALIAPAPPAPLNLPPEMKEQQKRAYESEQSVQWTISNILGNMDKLSEEDVELVIRDSLAGEQAAKEAWPASGMAEDILPLLDGSLWLGSGGSNIPINVLVGECDIVEPQLTVEKEVVQILRARGFEQVNLTVAKGAKHLIPLEDPGTVYREVVSLTDNKIVP